MKRFERKRAVVTGAAGDVGQQLCESLLNEGADVVGLDVDADAGDVFEARLRKEGHTFTFLTLDITDPDAVAAFGAKETSVDLLVNNAGVLAYEPLVTTSVDAWDRVQAINLRGAYLMTKALAHALTDGSAILNVSSVAAISAEPGYAAYSASKAGLVALSKVMAAELAPRTRVNVVCPGPLDTRMPRRLLAGHPDADGVMAAMADATLLKRLGRAEEVVPLCLFLGSDDARLMTGAAVTIDAGMTV